MKPESRVRILHDISQVVQPGLPEFPGDTPFSCGWTGRVAHGSSVNLSAITTSPHVGTHADALLHVKDGAPASEALAPQAFIGPAFLLDVSAEDGVLELRDLEPRLPARVERLLLRTGRTTAAGTFPEEWPCLSAACVEALCQRGMRLLGVDAPSVDLRHSKGLEAHHALFDAGGLNLENLDLRGVPEGGHYLLALPWRLAGLDAAPVRALLVEAL